MVLFQIPIMLGRYFFFWEPSMEDFLILVLLFSSPDLLSLCLPLTFVTPYQPLLLTFGKLCCSF